MTDHQQHLIGIVAGRSFTVSLDNSTDRNAAFDYVTGRLGPGRGPAPDTLLRQDWLDTVEGFRIRLDAVDAWLIGHKEGEWAVSGDE